MYGNPMGVKDGDQQKQPDPPHEHSDVYVKIAQNIGEHGFEDQPIPECPDVYTADSPGSAKAFQGKVEGISSEQSYYADWKSGASQEQNQSLPEQKVTDADVD